MPPLERVVYSTGRVEVGAFRCPPTRPDFGQAGPIRDHCTFVFPRTAVRIRHEGARAFTADAGVVTYYNPRQPYTRERIDPAGDRCEWFALDPELAAEVVSERDPAAGERPRAPFRFSHGPSDGAAYLAQRELFVRLARGDGGDALGVEEGALFLLRRVLGLAYDARGRAGERAPACRPRERDAAAHARELLGLRFREALTLTDLARAVGLSRFRLCRAFRAVTGTTLHAFREQLRLRAALEALGEGGLGAEPRSGVSPQGPRGGIDFRRAPPEGCHDLTGLALDLGYSSHSHFTASFRKAFGLTPSLARTRLRTAPRR